MSISRKSLYFISLLSLLPLILSLPLFNPSSAPSSMQASSSSPSSSTSYRIEDIVISESCLEHAKPGDHLLVEFEFSFENGTTFGPYAKKPEQLFHILLEQGSTRHIPSALKGMCINSTRVIRWESVEEADFSPILSMRSYIADIEELIQLTVTLHHITSSDDYQIFSALKQNNISLAMDLIDMHLGVNAVDEWGQTALMIATQKEILPLFAALLNARKPRIDVNIAKSSGYTALYYAVDLKTTTMLAALLRKGADPNAVIIQEGSKGNTPLHFACLMEKSKHAELLLAFGANPFLHNEFGDHPLNLIPKDTVRSVKLHFKRIFEEAYSKAQGLPSRANSEL